MKKKILVFASGTKDGGGSGFQELVENSRTGVLDAEIVAVVCNYENGGVRQKADKLKIPFELFKGPWEAQEYRKIISKFSPDLTVLSGWLKIVKDLDPKTTINIHPGPLPKFGGPGMYGHFVHEAIMESFRKGETRFSAMTMHFVNEEYDKGPVIFRYPVLIREEDTAETLGFRVNKIEHAWQSYITNLVASGKIKWDGQNPESLIVPSGYKFI